MRGRGERLGPERVLRAAVNEESPDAVVQRAKDALGLPVLLRCVQAGEPELGAMAGKESSQRAGVELPSVVCLQSKHTQTKLGTHVSMEMTQDRQGFGFVAHGEGPDVVGEIVKKSKVVFVTRETQHRGGPNIRMYKLEREISS